MTTKDKQLLKYCGVSWTVWIVLLITCAASAQVPVADSVVPRLVNYAGVAKDENGKAMKGVFGATFAVYADQDGGSPMWIETQNINANVNGTFSVQLGATKPDGLPVDLFSAGQARWLGVSYNGGAEQPRIALLSVPYALKAGDAQTLGGLPASAFMLAAPPSSSPSDTTASSASADAALLPASSVAGSGTLDFIPLWTSTSAIGNSVLFQTGSGSTAKIGINTTTPGATLDVKGTTNFEGILTLPAQGTATASGGKSSQPQDLVASSFSSSTKAAVNQTFQWKAEPSGNNTATPSGTLNLLFGSGTASPAETGLKLSSKGLFTFATGQTFPGTGTITGVITASGSGLSGGGTSGTLSLGLTTSCSKNQLLQWNGTSWACTNAGGTGTISGVTAGTDLTGGGTSGNVTLSLNTAATDARYAQLGASNSFTGNETVSGNLTANGTVSGGLGSFSGNSSNSIVNVIQNATSGPGFGLASTSYNNNRGQAAVLGQELSLANQSVFGVEGFIFGPNGAGTYGQVNNPQSTMGSKTGVAAGVWGDAGSGGTAAVVGTADGVNSIVGFNNSPSWATIIGENQNTSAGAALAPGVVGFSFAPDGMGVVGSGPVHSNSFNSYAGQFAVGVVGDSLNEVGLLGTSDNGTAVYGISTAGGTGVFGQSSTGTAVAGTSTSGSGVYGSTNNETSPTTQFAVWGNDVASDYGGNIAVYATSQFGDAVVGVSPDSTAIFTSTNTGGAQPFVAGDAAGNSCGILTGPLFGGADLFCFGAQSSIVQTGGEHWVHLYAVQSPENWFEDFGSGQLVNGSAEIRLEPTFAQTIASGDYRVFPVPNGDCKGLYVAQKTATGFVVRELGGGQSNVLFDYRIVARRRGYENMRLTDATKIREHSLELAQRAVNAKSQHLNVVRARDAGKNAPAIAIPIAPRTMSPVRHNVPVASVSPVAPAPTTHTR